MRHGKVFALALATGWVTMTVAMATDPTVVTLGTATPGGGFPVYGDAYSGHYPADTNTPSVIVFVSA